MGNVKKVLLFLISVLLISSCGTENEEVVKTEVEKKDFFIQTEKISNFGNWYNLKKTWKLSSSENISISSNAIWRVNSVKVRKWDSVNAWGILATLEDNIWSYAINLQKAQNVLENAEITKQSNILTLDKQIFDLETNLDTLKSNLAYVESDKQQSIKKSTDDLNSLNLDDETSKSSLELKKIEDNIEKLEFDYNTKLTTDQEIIEWYKLSLKKEHNSMVFLMDDVINFSDELLGVTPANKYKNDSFESFLWAKDSWQKADTVKLLLDIISYREEIDTYNLETEEDILNLIEVLTTWYDKLKVLLINVEEVLNNSIESSWYLSSTQISTYISSVNVYQSTMQWNYTAFVAFSNSVKSFLRTYVDAEESLKKQIDILKWDRDILLKTMDSWELSAEVALEKLIISYDDKIKSLKSQIEMAENNLDNTKKTRDVTIKSLNNAIAAANIWVQQAQKEYSKLTIKSPISWIVKEVNVDQWQEVANWTPMFSVLNNWAPEVIVYLSKSEHDKLEIWDVAYIKNDTDSFSWEIVSISNVADDNLKFLSTVSFKENLSSMWDVVDIYIPLDVERLLVPINVVTVLDDGVWVINILKDGKIETVQIELWELYWDKIEVIRCISLDIEDCGSLDVIITDVSNFDKNKFNLVVKEEEE